MHKISRPLIAPQWGAPKHVRAYTTTRQQGQSQGVYAGLNLGDHVKDDPQHVASNRQQLMVDLSLPNPPCWLEQVHGADVIHTDDYPKHRIADASITHQAKQVCTIMTADCLPILLCNQAGDEVAAVHGGWRSLAQGILANTIQKMKSKPSSLYAWLGPAISADVYQVGNEIRPQFPAEFSGCFVRQDDAHYLMDIKAIAALQLEQLGVQDITVDTHCTYQESDLFYSFRRDGVTGRMASLIWFDAL